MSVVAVVLSITSPRVQVSSPYWPVTTAGMGTLENVEA